MIMETLRAWSGDSLAGVIALTACAALVASFAVTPGVRRLARRWKILDRPDGHRKLHESPTSLGGGVSVLLGALSGVAALLVLDNPWAGPLKEVPLPSIGL